MAYLPALITTRLGQVTLVSLLCMTSLIATVYILVFVPNSQPKPLKKAKSIRHLEPESGPVRQYISYLNGALSLLCALNCITFRDKRGVHDGFWLLCLLPIGRWPFSCGMSLRPNRRAVSFTIVMLARHLMLSVDVDELENLKYEYKGA